MTAHNSTPVNPATAVMTSGASLSADGVYRYRLWRRWGRGPRMVWVMLNPSTADANVNDPTIRRCISFARREGYDAIDVINLYALRTPHPEHLLDHPDPEGPANLSSWQSTLGYPNRPRAVVAAWGAHATDRRLPGSQAFETVSIDDWLCLGKTQDGSPRHPLYVHSSTPLVPLVDGSMR